MTTHDLNVFVSYSHKDKAWLERVQVHLRPLARDGRLDLWDDTRIKTGQRWRDEIAMALAQADVAVLLISADFYASEFIANNELPPLLEASRSERGLLIAGVHINHSRFDRDQVLSEYQTVNTPGRPIEGLPKDQQEKVFDDLARRIEDLLMSPAASAATSVPHRTRLPKGGAGISAERDPTAHGRRVSFHVKLALLILAAAGALALVVGLAGDRIVATGSSVGDVTNSKVIINAPRPQEERP